MIIAYMQKNSMQHVHLNDTNRASEINNSMTSCPSIILLHWQYAEKNRFNLIAMYFTAIFEPNKKIGVKFSNMNLHTTD